ncbi:Conjugal transfer protein TraA [Legionella pneumophila]|uniref:Conjugal transfer protein TraA n=1 Tax=Legionella pneumophila TaxID=446 RepID=A0A378LPN2_LEGPN|nr:hypothetical protein [Legionella pneumophila]STY27812.1 Conjugal transfer protein TraA [Legionella pneumophila]
MSYITRLILVDRQFRGLQEDKTELRAKAKLIADRQDRSTQEITISNSKETVYKELQKNHPTLAKYQKLLDKRKNLTGYFAERIDKQINAYARELAKTGN